MATKLYLRDATQTIADTAPGGTSLDAATPTVIATGASTNRKLDTAIGSAQTSAAGTTSNTASANSIWLRRFVSRPLAAQVIGVQTITYSAAHSEGNANSDFRPSVGIYLYRPSTGLKVATILAVGSLLVTEPGTTETAGSATASSTSVTAQAEDVIVVEVWRASGTQTMAGANTNTAFYDGTTEASASNNAAFVNFGTTTLSFITIGSGTLTANAVLKRNQTGSFTADAVIRRTQQSHLFTKTFTFDASGDVSSWYFAGWDGAVGNPAGSMTKGPYTNTADYWGYTGNWESAGVPRGWRVISAQLKGFDYLVTGSGGHAEIATYNLYAANIDPAVIGSWTRAPDWPAPVAFTDFPKFSDDSLFYQSGGGIDHTLTAVGTYTFWIDNYTIEFTAGPLFTAEAVLLKARSGSFTADAFIRPYFYADAVLRRAQSGSFTVDAVLRIARSGSFTADAWLRRTQTSTLTADAVLKRTQSGSFTADAVVRVARSGSFIADAIIRRTQGSGTGVIVTSPATYANDAVVTATGPGMRFDATGATVQLNSTQVFVHTAHAWIPPAGDPTHARVDSIFLAFGPGTDDSQSVPFGCGYEYNTGQADGSLTPAPPSGTWTGYLILAHILVPAGATLSSQCTITDLRQFVSRPVLADAVFKRAQTGSFTADAVLRRIQAGSFTADAVVLRNRTGSFAADAALRSTQTHTFVADAIVRRSASATVTADAVIRATLTSAFTANAVIRQTVAASFSTNAVLLATRMAGFAADAVFLSPRTQSLTADAVLAANRTGVLVSDAVLRSTGTGSLTADAAIVAAVAGTGSFTVNAVFRSTQAGSFTADAAIRAVRASALTLDAVLRVGRTGGFVADAWMRRTESVSLSADAVLRAVSAHSVLTNAVLRATRSEAFIASAVTRRATASSFTADAYLAASVTSSLTADAILRRAGSASFTTDAVLTTGDHAPVYASITADVIYATIEREVDPDAVRSEIGAEIVSAQLGIETLYSVLATDGQVHAVLGGPE